MEMKVKDLMTTEPVSVSPEASLREVAEKLSMQHIGGVPVVTAGRWLVGVVSATDLVNFLASSTGAEPGETGLGPWEERPAEEEDRAARAPSYYAVVWPAREGELPALFGGSAGGEADIFEGHTAEEVMTRNLLTIDPEASVGEAAARMLEHDVHRLLVVERGQLEGVITTRDLIRVLTTLPAAATAGDALSEKP